MLAHLVDALEDALIRPTAGFWTCSA